MNWRKSILGDSGNNVKRLIISCLLYPLFAAVAACGPFEGKQYDAFNCHMSDRVIEYRIWIDTGDYQIWADDIDNHIQTKIFEGGKDWVYKILINEYPKHCRILGGKVESITVETE